MSTDIDDIIAREAVQRGWVSEARLEAAREAGRAEREAKRPPRSLAAVLAERGDLTLEQFNALVEMARLQSGSPSPPAPLPGGEGSTVSQAGLPPSAPSRSEGPAGATPPPSSSADYRFSPSQADDLAAARAGEVTRAGPTIARDGTRRTERPADNIRRLGRYEIVSELGRGGMGVVYSARDPQLNRIVALKVMTGDPDSEECSRFQREATAMARLRHPNIVPVFDVGAEDHRPYYTMEMVEGESLAVVLRRMRALPLRAALKIARDVAEALAEAHRNGLVHRDVKPGNILIANAPMIGVGGSKDSGEMPAASGETSLVLGRGTVATYRVLLSDFGLVRDLDSARLTRTGDIMGTPLYMSPEQARGESRAIGPLSDVYSLGAVLYEMVSGRPPFTEPELARLLAMIENDDSPSLRTLAPGTPRDVETIIQKAMAKDPARRYVSSAEFAQDIGRFLRGEPITARPSSLGYRLAKRIARHKAASAAIVVIGVAAAIVGWMTFGPGWVDLDVTPAAARITVNGEDRGPVRSLLLWPPGKYAIGVSAEDQGFLPVSEQVEVLPGKRLKRAFVLNSDSGWLTASVTPADSVLRLFSPRDEPLAVLKGRPARAALRVGLYKMQVEAAAHIPFFTTFEVRSAEERVLDPIVLQHEYGFLSAQANVDAVTIMVFVAGEEEFRRAAGHDSSPPGPPVAWQFSRRTFGPRGPEPLPSEALPEGSVRPEPRRPGMSRLRAIFDHEIPGTPPAFRLSLPIERFQLDTGHYRLIYLKSNHATREQYVRIESALRPDGALLARDAEAAEALRRDLIARGHRIAEGGVVANGAEFNVQDEGKRKWTVFPDRKGHTRCVATLNGRERWSFRTGGPVIARPALADVNADGLLDVLVGSTDGCFRALSGEDGRSIWEFQTGGEVRSSAAVADFDRDGVFDAAFGSSDGRLYALSGRDGAPLWDCRPGSPVRSSPALADLNGDGTPDVLFGADDGRLRSVSGKDGSTLWEALPRLGVGGPNTGFDGRSEAKVLDPAIVSAPAVADLDGDHLPDVAWGSGSESVRAVSGLDGHDRWERTALGLLHSSPVFGDLNRDGTPDLVIGSWDCRVYALSGRDGSKIWDYDTGSAVTSTPTLSDLDGDGAPEAIVGAFNSKVYALSGRNGEPVWSARVGGCIHSSPAIGDLDGDGTLDVVTGCDDGLVYALSASNGDRLWSIHTGGPVESTPALADLDADGALEVVVGSNDGYVYVFSGTDGRRLWEVKTGFSVFSSPALSDLNADGTPDCLIGSDDSGLYALSGADGRPLWTFWAGDSVRCPPALSDLDRDGTPDAVFGAFDFTLRALSGRDGSPLWDRPLPGIYQGQPRVEAYPALADLNGDRSVDLIAGQHDGRISALSGRDGTPLWEIRAGGCVCSTPAVADLDGDGTPEGLVGSHDGIGYVISGRDGSIRRRIEVGGRIWASPALGDLDGDALADVVFSCEDRQVHAFSGREGAPLWNFPTGGIMGSAPALADLDGDGRLDVVVGADDGWVYAFRGKDAKPIWSLKTGGIVNAAPAIFDLGRDGSMDVVLQSAEGKVFALAGRDGRLLWEFRLAQRAGPSLGVDSSMAFADLDGDGVAEGVIGSPDSRVYALRTGPAGRGGNPATGDRRFGAERHLLRARRAACRCCWAAVEAETAAGLSAAGDGSTPGHASEVTRAGLLALRARSRMSGRGPEAVADLIEAARVIPSNAGVRLDLAFSADDPSRAASSVAAAFLLDPAETWRRLDPVPAGPDAERCRERAQSAAALLADESAVASIDPPLPEAASADRRRQRLLLARALAWLRSGRPAEALPLLDELVRTDPRSLDALRFRGRARLDSGDAPGALEDWRATLRLTGRFPERDSWMAEAQKTGRE
ncbi:MAG: PQQ-binding-like beta-propeller repeat protein [Planctomycetes bacterium]|nr:PQQ-binding-like beta-propeller repeat protein [Planctomycetota bacterium]